MHREQQIVERIAELLYASVNAIVYVHRTLSLAEIEGELPAVSVVYGADEPQGANMAVIDSVLSVSILVYASHADEEALRKQLSDLRAQIHRALLADHTLGLHFVSDCHTAGASAPTVIPGDQMRGSREYSYRIVYRMNYMDPE